MCRLVQAMFLSCCIVAPALSSELSPDEQNVWNLEVNYWEYVKQNDIAKYRALWDERFVGWPSFSRSPMDKTNIHEWIAPLHEDPAITFDYELKMESVRSYGPDIVVAHYAARRKFISTETGDELPDGYLIRVTHTWQRKGEAWVIIAGTSGVLAESPPN